MACSSTNPPHPPHPPQDKANPLAQVLSAAMMLRYAMGEEKAAKRCEEAVLAVLDGGYRTGDIMSENMVCLSHPHKSTHHHSLLPHLWSLLFRMWGAAGKQGCM